MGSSNMPATAIFDHSQAIKYHEASIRQTSRAETRREAFLENVRNARTDDPVILDHIDRLKSSQSYMLDYHYHMLDQLYPEHGRINPTATDWLALSNTERQRLVAAYLDDVDADRAKFNPWANIIDELEPWHLQEQSYKNERDASFIEINCLSDF